MIEAGRSELDAIDGSEDSMSVHIGVDIRYQGQGDSVMVDLATDPAALGGEMVNERFLKEYLKLFGSRPPDVDAEVLTWRVRVSGQSPRPRVSTLYASDTPLKGSRMMWFAESKGLVEGQVFDRYGLEPGTSLQGPCVVEERESTVVVGPGGVIAIGDMGNLKVKIDG